MNRRSTQHYADEANLQADVMRFMAIVAFCLVAILAIVRNVEPVIEPLTHEEPEPPQSPPDSSDPAPDAASPAEPEKVLHAYVPRVSPAPRPTRIAEAEPTQLYSPPRQDPPDKPTTEKAATAKQPAENQPERESPPEPEPAPASSPRQEADIGLALRFASDGDFLRLINKGTVTLYAIADNDYQKYDVAHRFVPATPPEHYYEVVATTVPSIVADILRDRSIKWAVGLPPVIEQQISTHIAQDSTGELLINRFSEVRHVSVQ